MNEKNAPTIKEKKAKNVGINQNTTDRLKKESNTILKHYIKKVPSLILLNHQISELQKAKEFYDLKGDKKLSNITDNIIKDLTLKVKLIKDKTGKKGGDILTSDTKKDIIKNDSIIQDLYNKQKDLINELKNISPSSIYNKLRDFNRDLRIFGDKKVIDISKVNVNYDNDDALVNGLNGEVIEKEYNSFLSDLSEKLNLSIEKLKELSESEIKTLIKNKFGSRYADLKSAKVVIDDKISIRRNELTSDIDKDTNIVSIVSEIFDFDEELSSQEIQKIKSIMTSSYIDLATSIARNVCIKYNNLNNLNDAISGALMALTETVNKWFEDTKRTGTLITFGYLVGANMKRGAEKAIIDLQGGSASASTKNNIYSERKKAIESYRKYNKGSEILSDEIILSMIADSEITALNNGVKGVKSALINDVFNEVSETDLSSMIGEEDEMNYWDIYENGEVSESDISDAKDNIKSLSDCVNKLMSYFKVVATVDSNGVTEYDVDNTVSMFDEIDKLIFFNYYGNVVELIESGKENINYNDIAEIIAKNTAEKEGVDIKYVKRMDVSTISKRIANIKHKINIIIESDIDVKRALEYLYIWMKQNPEATFLASNHNEKLVIKAYEQDDYYDNYNNQYADGDDDNDIDDYFRY